MGVCPPRKRERLFSSHSARRKARNSRLPSHLSPDCLTLTSITSAQILMNSGCASHLSLTLPNHTTHLRTQGFFTLFWISIFIWAIRTYIRSIETEGAPLNLRFATMLSQDAWTLALSDAVLVLSTGICVPFARAVSRGWIKYYWTGAIIQHLLQTFILFAAIKWTFNRSVSFVRVRRLEE